MLWQDTSGPWQYLRFWKKVLARTAALSEAAMTDSPSLRTCKNNRLMVRKWECRSIFT